jgi:hypothetical protein
MLSTRKFFATTMIAAAGAVSAALALSATATAEPAPPPPSPALPGLPFIQQLVANPAAASQLMQGLATVLSTAQGATAAPATPPPAATASVTLPQPPAALPGTPAAPVNTPAATPATAPQNVVPTGQMNVPNVPFLPVPLPQSVAFPGDLAALMPAGTPLANLAPKSPPATAPAATAPAATAPAAPPAPAPAAPAAPGAGVAPLLMPLSALP